MVDNVEQGDLLGKNLGNPGKRWWWLWLGWEVKLTRFPSGLNGGYSPKCFGQSDWRWSCHHMRWGKRYRWGGGKCTTTRSSVFCKLCLKYQAPKQKYQMGSRIWGWSLGNVNWQYKLGILYRVACESTGSPETKIWTIEPPKSRGQRGNSRGNWEGRKTKRIVFWKSNKLSGKEHSNHLCQDTNTKNINR